MGGEPLHPGDAGRTEYDLFIDGTFREPTDGQYVNVEYPYDGTVWAEVARASTTDVDDAVNAARRAFDESWGELLPTDRRRVLHQIAETIDEHAEELGRLETWQNGKLIREMESQMRSLGDWYRYYAGVIDKIEGNVLPVENKDGGLFAYTRNEPLGVVGAITPWNSPLLLLTFKLAPALAAGNTVVHKPSEKTPISALRLAELFATETDLPEGVYNVVPGTGSEAGVRLVEHDGVDKLAFTGSTEVGRTIGSEAGKRLVPATLELGGKSPNVVFADADLDNALNGVVKGIFAATGQTCLAGSRVFVHEDISDEFLDRFVDRAEDITLGDPMDPDTQMGPIAFRSQWETVSDYVETAVEEGATVVSGGGRPDELSGECFFQPTILTEVDDGDTVANEEIFGPVAVLFSFASEDELVERANDVDFGLAAGIWTEDIRRAQRVAERIEAGTVWINEYRTLSYSAPFGGYKDSGLGYENGREGLEEYYKTKTIWLDRTGEVADPFTLG